MTASVNDLRLAEFTPKSLSAGGFDLETKNPFEALDTITLRAIGKLQEQDIFPDNISVDRQGKVAHITYGAFQESPITVIKRVRQKYHDSTPSNVMSFFGLKFLPFTEHGDNMPESYHILAYIAAARLWANSFFTSEMILTPHNYMDEALTDMLYEDRLLYPKSMQKTFPRDQNVTLGGLISMVKEYGLTSQKIMEGIQLNQFVSTSEGQFVEFLTENRCYETWPQYLDKKDFSLSDYNVFIHKLCDAIENEVFGTDEARSDRHYNIFNAIRLLCSKLNAAFLNIGPVRASKGN